jgi:hypothetical protein
MRKLATLLVVIALLVGGLTFGTTITATPVEVTGLDFVEFDLSDMTTLTLVATTSTNVSTDTYACTFNFAYDSPRIGIMFEIDPELSDASPTAYATSIVIEILPGDFGGASKGSLSTTLTGTDTTSLIVGPLETFQFLKSGGYISVKVTWNASATNGVPTVDVYLFKFEY